MSKDKAQYRIRQHAPSPDLSFTYFYECAEAHYATQSVRNGQVPRTTDLLRLEEARTFVRFSTLSDGGSLKRHVELTDTAIRTVTPKDLKRGAKAVPHQALNEVTPGTPLSLKHTYEVGGEGGVARNIYTILSGFVGPDTGRSLIKLIDIFSWAPIIYKIPEDIEVGQSFMRESFDVDLLGGDYHNHGLLVIYDRVDEIDGALQAYFKIQSQGNFSEARNHDSNYHAQFHVALTGPAQGLVTRGEMQEIIFEGGKGGEPLTINQRQVAMYLQSDAMRSGVI